VHVVRILVNEARFLNAWPVSTQLRCGAAGPRRGDRIVVVAGRPARDPSVSDVGSLSDWRRHTPLTVRTSNERPFYLAIGQFLRDLSMVREAGLRLAARKMSRSQ
jgi:hypothetical protein